MSTIYVNAGSSVEDGLTPTPDTILLKTPMIYRH